MIDRDHDLPLTRQAAVLNISRGSLYYKPRPVSAADLALMRRMDELHLEFMSLLKFPHRLEILAGSPYRHLCMPKTSSV